MSVTITCCYATEIPRDWPAIRNDIINEWCHQWVGEIPRDWPAIRNDIVNQWCHKWVGVSLSHCREKSGDGVQGSVSIKELHCGNKLHLYPSIPQKYVKRCEQATLKKFVFDPCSLQCRTNCVHSEPPQALISIQTKTTVCMSTLLLSWCVCQLSCPLLLSVYVQLCCAS